jgi:hypothetical protein
VGVEKIISFTSWANDHPSDRLPSDRLDAQFDVHANAINALEARISKLLRDDGKLNHGLLAADSIPNDLFRDIVSHILDEAVRERRLAEKTLEEIRYRQEDIWRRLDEAKIFAAEASHEFSRNLALVSDVVAVQEDLSARLTPLAASTRDIVADFQLQTNVATLTSEASENWADVSRHWAEHMPDILPANILATNAVTGDHWSSRWWANQAAQAVGGFLFHFYLGPLPEPPLNLADGSPLQPGMIYYDTDTGVMYVFTGSTWVPFSTPQTATTSSLFYVAAANQTVFPLTVGDVSGKTAVLDPTKAEGVEVCLNGVRLTPSSGGFTGGDYTVNLPTSTITLATPVSINSVVAVDVLKDPADLAAGSVRTVKLKKFVFDGITTTFALLDANTSLPVSEAVDAVQIKIILEGVDQEPGVDFTLAGGGASIIFSSAPPADAKVFAVYLYRSEATVTAGVSSFNGRVGAVTLAGSDVTTAGGALTLSPVFTGDPKAPTPLTADNDTSIATTAFVKSAISAGLSTGAVTAFNTRSGAVTLLTADVTGAGGAPINSPVFTGVPAAPTLAAGDSSTKLATTGFVAATLGASPAFGGNPTAPTPSVGDNDTSVATTAFVVAALANSPVLGGNPTAPTAAAADNDTSVATTAFVKTAIASTVTKVVSQVFTTPGAGTYTPTAGMVYCLVECLGGGGGGGSVLNGTSGLGWTTGGGGGGAGGYSRSLLAAAAIGASKPVTVGAGGAGGTVPAQPGNGGDSSLSTLCVGKGGSSFGINSAEGYGFVAGGPGGVAGTGNVVTGVGQAGGAFFGCNAGMILGGGIGAPTNFGGSTQFGAGGGGIMTSLAAGAGNPATGFGGGGGGAVTYNGGGAANGGAGANGIVIVTEFCH